MIDNISVPAKIEELSAALAKSDPEGLKRLDLWREKVKALDDFSVYSELPITQAMISKAIQIIRDARAILATDKKLTERERDALFAKIDAHLWYVDMFDINRIQRELDGIGRSLEAELEQHAPKAIDTPYSPPNLEAVPGDTPPSAAQDEIYPSREDMPIPAMFIPDSAADAG